jgi:hypothetical protein
MAQLIRVPAAPEPAGPAAEAVVIELLDALARITVEAGVDAAALKTVLIRVRCAGGRVIPSASRSSSASHRGAVAERLG